MKKFTKIITVVLLIALISAFGGCDLFKNDVQTGEKTITIVFDMTPYEGDITVDTGVTDYTNKKKEFTVTTEATTLEAVLDELVADKKVTYAGTKNATTGIMINNIDNIITTGNQFFALYTNDTANSDTQYGIYDYYEKSLGSAIKGATSLPVKDGFVYVITISTW